MVLKHRYYRVLPLSQPPTRIDNGEFAFAPRQQFSPSQALALLAEKNTTMAANSGVIDWGEAMQQVGDDEEFLRELLGDLRSELQTQLVTIQNIIQVGGLL